MRAWAVRVLLAGCGGVLLSLQGCTVPTSLTGLEGEGPSQTARAAGPGVSRAEAPFRLPGDNAGKMLGQVLPPLPRPGALRDPAPLPPKDLPPPRWRDVAVLLPTAGTDLARLPAPQRKDTRRPEFVLEEGLEDASPPALPREPSFPTPAPARVESEDASLPPPLPVLATPLPDRVPAEDVTTEASTQAVLAAPLPVRTAPAPYVRMSVPDPFENRKPLTVSVPAEETAPQAGPAGGPQ